MKTYIITGSHLPVLFIKAESFDEALEQARLFSANYNSGQMLEDKEELRENQIDRYRKLFDELFEIKKV